MAQVVVVKFEWFEVRKAPDIFWGGRTENSNINHQEVRVSKTAKPS